MDGGQLRAMGRHTDRKLPGMKEMAGLEERIVDCVEREASQAGRKVMHHERLHEQSQVRSLRGKLAWKGEADDILGESRAGSR